MDRRYKEHSILIVDDMTATRTLVRTQLQTLELANFCEAEDGAQAWHLLEECYRKQSPLDIIICDWNMPKMSGLELLKRVRGDDRFSKIPFIMLTAQNETEEVMAAIELGVSEYIIKPFNAEQLHKKMNWVIKKFL
ncbi:response regulator [bacterium]|nr:response regulator [bacterium]